MMSRNEIAWRRLENQRITGGGGGSAIELVRWLGAMQAQDYTGTLWSVGLRTGWTQEAVERALEAGEIVRTWPMRGTLHIIPAQDVRWMLQLMTPRVVAGAAKRRQELGLTDADFSTARRVLEKALSGGRALERPAIHALMEQAGVPMDARRGYHLIWRLAQEGFLCHGPRMKKQPTFVLLEEWVKKSRNLSREEGLAEMARRYFTSHGPATLQDFVWWTGLRVAEAKEGLESVKKELTCLQAEGEVYWMAESVPAAETDGVFLLPGFDEYLLGYRHRAAVLDAEHAGKIVPGGNGMFLATLVVRGRVAGIWKRTLRKQEVAVNITPFGALSKKTRSACAKEATRYGKFLKLRGGLAD